MWSAEIDAKAACRPVSTRFSDAASMTFLSDNHTISSFELYSLQFSVSNDFWSSWGFFESCFGWYMVARYRIMPS
jgi:hypothetical protein